MIQVACLTCAIPYQVIEDLRHACGQSKVGACYSTGGAGIPGTGNYYTTVSGMSIYSSVIHGPRAGARDASSLFPQIAADASHHVGAFNIDSACAAHNKRTAYSNF